MVEARHWSQRLESGLWVGEIKLESSSNVKPGPAKPGYDLPSQTV